jgi:alpha-tubulin suppressor-like RCC1 family protein
LDESTAGHSCGVKKSGKVACWGFNGYGQTDVPPGLG